MQLTQKPVGFAASFSSHTDPANFIPPPKIPQQKEEETLMGHCLKSFIKERLYGNFMNYAKRRDGSPNSKLIANIAHIASIASAHPAQNHPQANSVPPLPKRTSRYAAGEITRQASKYLAESELNKSHNRSKGRISHRNSIGSTLQQSINLRSQRHKHNRSDLAPQRSHQQHIIPSSFLSAIEEEDRTNAPIARRHTRLIPIQPPQSMPTTTRVIKREVDKSSISSAKWDIFCQPRLKPAKSISQSSDNLINGVLQGLKSGKLGKPQFSKEGFLQNLNNSVSGCPLLANQILSFFEISSKLYDEMKMEDFKTAIQTLITANNRMWAVAAFRFWDLNQNGSICSNDIFALYQKIDEAEQNLNQIGESNSTGMMHLRLLKQNIETLQAAILENRAQQNQTNEVKYIEEGLLRQKGLRFSDLLLVVGGGESNHRNGGSVIQSNRELGLKFSSCYRYSVLATDHNEQTRQNREYLEKLKEGLRTERLDQSKRQKNNGLLKGSLPQIGYAYFLEKEMWTSFKQIAFHLFGIEIAK